MSAHAGQSHVVADAGAQQTGLLFGLSSHLTAAAQFLFMTSLFAALLSFHSVVYRYTFALSREGLLPSFLSATGRNSVPKAASLTQSATGLIVIGLYAWRGWSPQTDLFFWLGTSGGFGVLCLLAGTSVAVLLFFRRDPLNESLWSRVIAPLLSAAALITIVVLAVQHYATLLGVPPGSVTATLLPGSYALVAMTGLFWAGILRVTRPQVHAAVGLGAHTATGEATLDPRGARS
jgi:amino acid transporter